MFRRQTARGLVGATVMLIVLWLGAMWQTTAQSAFTIPVVVALTGPIATFGQEILHGGMLAAEDLNKAGGVKAGPWKGQTVKLDGVDDRGDPQEGAITERGYKSAIRLVTDDNINGVAQVDLAVKAVGGKNLGILYANTDYGRGLYEVGTKRAKELGVKFIAEPYNEGETDYNAAVNRLKAANVDMVVHFGFYTEAALQRRQALQQGLKTPFVAGPGSVSSEFIRLGGDAVEGAIVVDFLREEMDTPKLKELAARTKEKFNEGFNLYHRNGYDAVTFVAKALESARGNSRADVNKALLATQIKGLMYEIKLNPKGNMIVPLDRFGDYFFLKVVKGGKFVYPGLKG